MVERHDESEVKTDFNNEKPFSKNPYSFGFSKALLKDLFMSEFSKSILRSNNFV
jgi:hypothetical protein